MHIRFLFSFSLYSVSILGLYGCGSSGDGNAPPAGAPDSGVTTDASQSPHPVDASQPVPDASPADASIVDAGSDAAPEASISDAGADVVSVLDASSGCGVTSFPLPTASNPRLKGIVAGPDGNIWVTKQITASNGLVARITPSGTVTEFSVASEPEGIASGPDGNLWYTANGKFGKITPTGTVTEFATGGFSATAIVSGPNGNLWFTEIHAVIGNVSTAGVISKFDTPIYSEPQALTVGPDGNLWFTDVSAVTTNKVAKATPAGVVTEFDLSAAPVSCASVAKIASGPDGNLWITCNEGEIVKVTPAGAMTPFSTSHDVPSAIIPGRDGNLWFAYSSSSGGGVGKITPTGAITRCPISGTANTRIEGIAQLQDGTFWVVETEKNQVDRIQIH